MRRARGLSVTPSSRAGQTYGIREGEGGVGARHAEAGQIGRYHAIVFGQRGDQVAKHVRRRAKAVQQQYGRRVGRAGFTVEHVGAIDGDAGAAPLIADHLALDMLNTEAGVGDAQQDFWWSSHAVLDWLARCGIDVGQPSGPAADALLRDAKVLRAAARDLITRRMEGKQGDPALLNRYLAALVSTPVLVWDEAQPHLVRQGEAASPARALGVLAEAVATLLAEGDFTLVRQCEHPECILWFYDRTKSHRRRWCSMALCGNRQKAAQFRARHRLGV